MELFHERVTEISRQRRISLDSATEYYLVFLLATHGNGRIIMRDLGELFMQGRSEAGIKAALKLQTVGDSALMIAGFWPEFTERHHALVSVDYYIRIGEIAYSLINEGRMLDGPFNALSADFKKFVWLLNEMSQKFSLTSMQDILKLYERWQHTHDPRLAQVLRSQGIDVIAAQNPRSVH